jgi:type II secretory pathway predicted ATPase ExeA
MPVGRDLAPAMLHRHAGHGEAVARISWCVDQRAIGVITGVVGAGKTVAVRAATANLDPSRHVVIYLANPTIGVRGMLTHLVAALGHTPAFHRATLAPQAAEALASEQRPVNTASSHVRTAASLAVSAGANVKASRRCWATRRRR